MSSGERGVARRNAELSQINSVTPRAGRLP